jgi:hydrogenase maturation protease
VAASLRGRAPAGVEVVEHEGEPIDLVELVEGAPELWVVDAVCSGAPAGTLHRLDASSGPLPAELFGVSTHRLGLADALELARALGKLPPRVVVYGVEGSQFEPGSAPSELVALAAERLADTLVKELTQATEASTRPVRNGVDTPTSD